MSLLYFRKLDSEVEFFNVFFPEKGHKFIKADEVLHFKKFIYANLKVRGPSVEGRGQHSFCP